MRQVFVFAALLLAASVGAQEFIGVPLLVVTTTEQGTIEETLSDAEMRENLVVIDRDDGGNYFWLTRGNVRLNRVSSGIYTIYYATNGAGYVKVNTLNDQFIEHVHTGLTTITYYGMQIREEWKDTCLLLCGTIEML